MIGLAWTQTASRDLARQVAYVAQFDPDAAARLGEVVEARAEWLRQVPRAGPALGRGGLRSFRVRGTQLTIVYRLGPGRLSIVRIRHAKQNWR